MSIKIDIVIQTAFIFLSLHRCSKIEVTLSTLFCNILHQLLYWEQLRFAIVFKSQDDLAIY